MKSINLSTLLKSIGLSLGVGILSGILTMGNVDIYKTLNLPPLSPPSFIFPIVWTVLFFLMGISAYLIYTSSASKVQKKKALTIYALQLSVNFFWSILFFNFNAYLLSFIWLLLLWLLILVMIYSFSKINKTAAILQIPYLLWVTFAGYLNLAIYFLNR